MKQNGNKTKWKYLMLHKNKNKSCKQ
jgi:hypothetical protein